MTVRIEVVYALPQACHQAQFDLAAGCTVADAIYAARRSEAFAGLDLDPASVGVFGRLVAMDAPLSEGDRVEFYRPLAQDPKERRRTLARLAAAGKV